MTPAASAYVLQLHRAARGLPHRELQPWVFDGLREIVPFDSAFWYRWSVDAQRSNLHAHYLYRQPESLIEEYIAEDLWRVDEVYERALQAAPGTAVAAPFEAYRSPKMRDFLARHHQYQVMTIGLIQEVPRIAAGISLYRDRTRPPFSAADVQMVELLAPHLIDAWRENWLQEISRTARSAPATEFSLGVLLPAGMLSEAQHRFGELIQREWPDWRGPWLPPALHVHLGASTNAGPYVGRHVVAYHRRRDDGLRLLLVRARHALDGLPPRKRETACLFAAGASQIEVAQRLRLSPSTVNNYLVDVYRELAIADKTDLALLVMRLEP